MYREIDGTDERVRAIPGVRDRRVRATKVRLYYSFIMIFIAYAFEGPVHVFAGRVKIVSHSSCRTSALLKYFNMNRTLV